ncbi:hypothetical protein SPBR_02144 [Sporothrix brasiliensis 5110]|uniref:Uncharacterized protein n=1 Tax=Sporothrix brasiliensis 5110 TaxID=1398154 RepID=A0A0C2IY80_9PEZI|nr:uncharacterized protein SPBR_02144 [Sporothrix brasiliensis 5110]KIH91640.1 hypothetical protein SPBR_02144 [Sporothrix brasiliensis 5110]
MQPFFLLSAAAAVVGSFASIAQATPIPCPDSKIDLILNGKLSPDACCSYGICKGDILTKSKNRK